MDVSAEVALYLVPTPIGNLADMTYRAVEVLKSVNVVLAEDTRTSGKLLKHYEISTRLESYHIFNEHKQVEKIIERLKNGEKMALISDAGTPSISDPGFLITRACIENNLIVQTLPGATAFVPALVNSGFPTDKFCFWGFIPHKKGKQTFIKSIEELDSTCVVYESPHRLVKTLQMMEEFFEEDREISISRELSKLHEETARGTAKELKEYFEAKGVKGELVLVIKGK